MLSYQEVTSLSRQRGLIWSMLSRADELKVQSLCRGGSAWLESWLGACSIIYSRFWVGRGELAGSLQWECKLGGYIVLREILAPMEFPERFPGLIKKNKSPNFQENRAWVKKLIRCHWVQSPGSSEEVKHCAGLPGSKPSYWPVVQTGVQMPSGLQMLAKPSVRAGRGVSREWRGTRTFILWLTHLHSQNFVSSGICPLSWLILPARRCD